MEIKQEIIRYVIATFDNPTTYLSRRDGKYCFIDNFIECTKTPTRGIAESLKHYFYEDTGLTDIDLVVIPLKIEYKLVNELE